MINELEKLAKAATPGPWVGDTQGWDGHAQRIIYVADGSYKTLAKITGKWDGFEKDQDANTKFIAAANPEVVLALIKVVRLAKEVEELHHEETDPDMDLNEALTELEILGGKKSPPA